MCKKNFMALGDQSTWTQKDMAKFLSSVDATNPQIIQTMKVFGVSLEKNDNFIYLLDGKTIFSEIFIDISLEKYLLYYSFGYGNGLKKTFYFADETCHLLNLPFGEKKMHDFWRTIGISEKTNKNIEPTEIALEKKLVAIVNTRTHTGNSYQRLGLTKKGLGFVYHILFQEGQLICLTPNSRWRQS